MSYGIYRLNLQTSLRAENDFRLLCFSDSLKDMAIIEELICM